MLLIEMKWKKQPDGSMVQKSGRVPTNLDGWSPRHQYKWSGVCPLMKTMSGRHSRDVYGSRRAEIPQPLIFHKLPANPARACSPPWVRLIVSWHVFIGPTRAADARRFSPKADRIRAALECAELQDTAPVWHFIANSADRVAVIKSSVERYKIINVASAPDLIASEVKAALVASRRTSIPCPARYLLRHVSVTSPPRSVPSLPLAQWRRVACGRRVRCHAAC
ncbi:unnamed protein product, partial [Iphiclides podalirius]